MLAKRREDARQAAREKKAALLLQQKKIEVLQKEKGREDGMDYTAKIVYDPNTVESSESVEVVGEVHEPDSKS